MLQIPELQTSHFVFFFSSAYFGFNLLFFFWCPKVKNLKIIDFIETQT